MNGSKGEVGYKCLVEVVVYSSCMYVHVHTGTMYDTNQRDTKDPGKGTIREYIDNRYVW